MLSRLLTRREQLVLAAAAAAILMGSIVVVFARDSSPPPTASPAPPPSPAPAAVAAPQPVTPSPAPPLSVLAEPPVPPVKTSLTIAVTGAVERPGTYSLPVGAHVQQALVRAGGATGYADLSDINTAAELIDGTTLIVPAGDYGAMEGNRLVVRSGQQAAALNPAAYTISRCQQGTPIAPLPIATTSTAAPAASASTEAASGLLDLNTATEAQLEELPGIGPKLAGEIVRYRAQSRFTKVDDLQNVTGIGPKRLDAIRSLVTAK